jgi:CRISPR-associated exonuclease Cas4
VSDADTLELDATGTDATKADATATDATPADATEVGTASPGRVSPLPSGSVSFGDLARAAYCPRQLYYARRVDDRTIPDSQRARIDLAFRYPELLDLSDRDLADRPIDPPPARYRRRLRSLRDGGLVDRFDVPWRSLVNPADERVLLVGRTCHGIAHKVIDGPDSDGSSPDPPPIPTIVSPGTPPETGVWEPQAVRAVAVAKALAWEREREIPRALVEYPAVGVVREVRLTVRRLATYRRALRAARGIDGPPPRVNDARCPPCEFHEKCGTRTRSLRSRLGL